MGVPSFYRWLVGKYPKIVVSAIDEGESCDPNDPNPNGEFDNFYLDMNGIIHPCFHPDDELFPPTTFDEVFVAIFEYIDRLVRIVRPRSLLYLAVDGVAPRAKMNQQRARRYRTAEDAEIAEKEEERLRREFESEGKELLPKQESEVSDSNVITPGTVFMQKLSKALEYYIRVKLNNDPFWKSILVIFSDSNVPGEGEHKFMSFIRLQRRLPGYDPNTRHCVYGLDADLIMLALATHEIHFSVLREDVLKQVQPEICLSKFVANSSQKDLDNFKSRQWFKKFETVSDRRIIKKPYQFLDIWILREYLELDMKPSFDSDIERVVDDFIFICFLAGNDFLPHLPSIEINENGIDLLIVVYKKIFKSMGDYLINISDISKKNAAYINFKAFKMFIMEVGLYENRIFEKRCTLRQRKLQRLLQEREKDKNDGIIFGNSDFNVIPENFNYSIGGSEHLSDSISKKCNISSSSAAVETSCSVKTDALENTKELLRKLKQFLQDKGDLFKNEFLENDKVKLSCPGWKARYYNEKFSAENTKESEAIRKELANKYFEGLCWVLQYYFTGVSSWSWYYPFYYAPFASDFKDLCCKEVCFAIGRPFRPFDQLMAVLPPRSSYINVPKAYMSLMNDENSPIINFYPKDFAVDYDGKRYTWQGVCKLPFIEEESLLEATKVLLKELQPEEMERNCVNSDKVFVMDSNSLFKKNSLQHQVSENHPKETQNHDALLPSFGIYNIVSFSDDSFALSKFTSPVLGMEDISNDKSRCATIIKPELQEHLPRPLDGVRRPEKTITEADIVERILWHDYPGYYPPQPQRQREVPTLPALANETWKSGGEGWGGVGPGKLLPDSSPTSPGTWKGARDGLVGVSAGRGKLLVNQTLAGPSKETWKGAGEGWNRVGRGKQLSDWSPASSGNDAWKSAEEGFGWGGGVGRGRLFAADRNLAGPGRELKPPFVFPATHLNMKDERNNMYHYGRGEYSAAPSVSTHLNMRNNTNHYGRGEYSAAASVSSSKFDGNYRPMDERWTANRSDDWRQRSTPMVSPWGRGTVRPPSNSYGSHGGGGRGSGNGYQKSMWVQRKPE